MKFGKNDRLMIAIGCSVAIVSLMIADVVLPADSKLKDANAQISTLDAQYRTTQTLAKSGLSTTDLEEQKKKYKEYQEFFFNVEDAFSIDSVLNELCQKYGLSLTSMQIAPASLVTDNVASGGTVEDSTSGTDATAVAATDTTAVSSIGIFYSTTATVNITGDYNSIMLFVDALDSLGKSVVVSNVSIISNERASEEQYSSSVTVTATFYGIYAPEYSKTSESVESNDPDGVGEENTEVSEDESAR